MTNQQIDRTTIDTITPRQLRKLLFYFDEQDITVRELRERLFEKENQDMPVHVDFALNYNLGL